MSQRIVNATAALSQSVTENGNNAGAGKGNRTPLASLEG